MAAAAVRPATPFVLIGSDGRVADEEAWAYDHVHPSVSGGRAWNRRPKLSSDGVQTGKYAIQHLGPVEIQDHTAQRVVLAVQEKDAFHVHHATIKLGPHLRAVSPLTLIVKDGKPDTVEITRRGGKQTWTIDIRRPICHTLEVSQ